MAISKAVIVTLITTTLSFGKIDFVKFSDICDIQQSKSCKNIEIEIKVIQYLLKKKLNSSIEVNGKLDSETKRAIIALQIQENIPANGYIGKNTKEALNKLLYGHKLHDDIETTNSDLKRVKLANKTKSDTKEVDVKSIKTYREFINKVNLKKSYAIYKDPKLLQYASAKNSLLKVDISEQRLKLIVNGKVALDTPCTTGSKHKLEPNTRTYRDKRTPLGTFKIIEKIANKRSTIFGNIYRKGKLIYHGDRRKYRGSWRGVKFVGAPLKNWMRITSNGIGLHASNHIKRYPGSNGCIRIPPKVATTIFKKVKPGTKVKVVN